MKGAGKSPVLVLPGLGDSGPEHWQSRWEAADGAFKRVAQRDWDRPQLAEWVDTLHRCIGECRTAPVLAAHSLACALVAHWAKRHGSGKARSAVKAALLVSPSDVDSPAHTPPEVRGFSPLPLMRLPFPTIVVASTDDPYVDFARAELFASSWGSRLVALPKAGHINAASGLGDWPQGRRLLEELRA